MQIRFYAVLFTLLCWLTNSGAAVTLGNQTSFYPRMLRLNSNAHLIASFDYGNTQSTIWDSADNGATWTQIATINLGDPGHCCSGLYETPQGALLWTTSTTNGSVHTIKIYRSMDQGHTWNLLSTPVTGSTGVWEAEFATDSTGRLVMYYSSEEYKGSGYNQLIAERISNDGGVTWSSDTIVVGVSDGNVQRPGMPLVARLPNGSYVMTYEVCGGSNCDAFIRTSSDGVNWGVPSNLGTRIESTSGNHFTQTPTVRWYNDGSANGRLLVTGMVLRRNADNGIAAGNGQTFMFNTNNGVGPWTEGATPQAAATSGGSDVCNGYSTQLLPSTNGAQLYELVNVGCSIKFAAGPMNNPIASGIYTLISKNSGLALDVNGCSTLAGANVQQWTPNGAACQAWRPEPVGGGYFRFVSKNSGLVLDVDACSTAPGGNVQQWQWLGGDCQRWKLQPSP